MSFPLAIENLQLVKTRTEGVLSSHLRKVEGIQYELAKAVEYQHELVTQLAAINAEIDTLKVL